MRPAPISPAMPTTSPLLHLDVDALDHLPVGMDAGGRRTSSSPRRPTSPILGSRGGKRSSSGRPTIKVMILSSLISPRAERADGLAVADDRHVVGDAAHFVELVRDQDRGDALALELEQQVEQRLAVFFREADAVGSSRISSSTSLLSALAISTSCCLPTPILVMRVLRILVEADLLQELAQCAPRWRSSR